MQIAPSLLAGFIKMLIHFFLVLPKHHFSLWIHFGVVYTLFSYSKYSCLQQVSMKACLNFGGQKEDLAWKGVETLLWIMSNNAPRGQKVLVHLLGFLDNYCCMKKKLKLQKNSSKSIEDSNYVLMYGFCITISSSDFYRTIIYSLVSCWK